MKLSILVVSLYETFITSASSTLLPTILGETRRVSKCQSQVGYWGSVRVYVSKTRNVGDMYVYNL